MQPTTGASAISPDTSGRESTLFVQTQLQVRPAATPSAIAATACSAVHLEPGAGAPVHRPTLPV